MLNRKSCTCCLLISQVTLYVSVDTKKRPPSILVGHTLVISSLFSIGIARKNYIGELFLTGTLLFLNSYQCLKITSFEKLLVFFQVVLISDLFLFRKYGHILQKLANSFVIVIISISLVFYKAFLSTCYIFIFHQFIFSKVLLHSEPSYTTTSIESC